MDEDNPGLAAGASRPGPTSSRAQKRRRCPSPQEETVGESSRSKRKPTPSSQSSPPLPLHIPPVWPPSHPSESTTSQTFGPMGMGPHLYSHHQFTFPGPSVVWPPISTTPATVHGDTGTCTERTTRPTKEPATSMLVNYDLASVSPEEQPRPAPLSVDTSSGSQQHPNSGATSSKPRLEDLPDPPAAQRPLQTIRVLATAALQSEPKGKLTLEEMVDRISGRFEYFQELQNRNKLKKSIRHALSLYSEFECSEDLESHTAKKVWHLIDEVPPNKYVRERKRKPRRTTAPDEIGQEEQVRPEREASPQDVMKESACTGESEDVEFIRIVRAGGKEKGFAPESSHAVEGAHGDEKISLAIPAPPATKPKLKRVLHGAAARSIINQILAEKESNDGDRTRSRPASPDESPPSNRLQASRWGISSSSQTTTPSALLQTRTMQSSLPFMHSAFGAKSSSFPPPTATKALAAAVQPSFSASTGFGSFARFGTLGLGGSAPVQAPNPSTSSSSAGTGTEPRQPLSDEDGS